MSEPRLKRRGVVKGTARWVVIVPPPEGSVFEQAIFVLRPDAEKRSVQPDELLREALDAADLAPPVLRPSLRWRIRRRLPWILTAAAAGLVAVGAVLFALL